MRPDPGAPLGRSGCTGRAVGATERTFKAVLAEHGSGATATERVSAAELKASVSVSCESAKLSSGGTPIPAPPSRARADCVNRGLQLLASRLARLRDAVATPSRGSGSGRLDELGEDMMSELAWRVGRRAETVRIQQHGGLCQTSVLQIMTSYLSSAP